MTTDTPLPPAAVRLNVQLPGDLHRRFKTWCASQELTIQQGLAAAVSEKLSRVGVPAAVEAPVLRRPLRSVPPVTDGVTILQDDTYRTDDAEDGSQQWFVTFAVPGSAGEAGVPEFDIVKAGGPHADATLAEVRAAVVAMLARKP